MNFYNQMFNPQYVNPQYFQEMQKQIEQYHFEQNKVVYNAVKAMHDLCEAVNKLDDYHKQIAFSGCIAEIAKANNWS